MKEKVRFLGLDVHAETIAVAIAEPGGEVRSLGTIANREESIRELIKKLGSVEQLRACYLEQAIAEAAKLAPSGLQEVIRLTGIARHRAYLGGNDCRGVGRVLPL
jgi:hypothetical protein